MKAAVVGLNTPAAADIPVPLKGTDCVVPAVPPELSVITRLAVLLPRAVDVNTM